MSDVAFAPKLPNDVTEKRSLFLGTKKINERYFYVL